MGNISGVNTSSLNSIDGFYTTQSGGGGTATTDPTFTVASSTTYFDQQIEVTNYATYTNPTYFLEVYVGATKIVSNTEVTVTDNRYLSWSDESALTGTRTIKLRAQEFGDYIDSNEVTSTYEKGTINFRYYRWYGSTTGPTTLTLTTQRIGINDIRLFTSAGQTGTEYPTTDLSTNTSETGIVVSAGQVYNSTYDAFKAFDSSTSTFYWSLGVSSGANNWLELEFDSGTYSTPPTLKSMQVRVDTNNQSSYLILVGSNTGAFSGEEVIITSINSWPLTSDTTFNIG